MRQKLIKFQILLLFSLVFVAADADSQATEAWKADVDTAKKLIESGDRLKAIEHLEKAAAATTSQAASAEIKLQIGTIYGKQDLNQSARLFCEAIDGAQGINVFKAKNNCATQLLKLGDNTRALTLLREMAQDSKTAELPVAAQSRISYNYARALEDRGDIEAAKDYYQRSLKADADFDKAAEAIARLSVSSNRETIGIPELLTLNGQLIDNGKFNRVEENLKRGLGVTHWQNHAKYSDLIIQMTQFLAHKPVLPVQFRENWEPFLDDIAPSLPQRYRSRIRGIVRAYRGKIKTEFENKEFVERHGHWIVRKANNDRDFRGVWALSDLYQMLGDFFNRRERRELALIFYVTALAANPDNLDAGVYAANLLAAEKQLQEDYLEPFVSSVFVEKGWAYQGRDWEGILRFHTVLGSLYEGLEIWGSEYQVRSAIFQWSNAVIASQEALKINPDYKNSTPRLRERLAASYLGNNQHELAIKEYILAREHYLQAGLPREAERVETTLENNFN